MANETVFYKKDSVFFVGGITTKVGDTNAGGCTLEAWNDPAKLNKTLANVMKADGTPIASQTACMVSNNGSGKVRITKSTAAFVDVVPGLVTYANFSAVYENGRYEVLAVQTGMFMWIDIDLNYQAPGNGEPTCDVKVGGAFDIAQIAWLSTDATQGYSVIIYSNKGQSKTNGDFTTTWNLGLAGGSLTNKSFKRFTGFTTQPEDGGQITFDGEDAAAFNPDGGICFNSTIVNVIFENVIVKDAYVSWRGKSANANSIRFINCQGNSGVMGWVLYASKGFVLIDCQGNDNSAYGFSMSFSAGNPNHLLINCIAHGNVKEGFYKVGGAYGTVLLGCIAYDNGNGGTKYSGFSTASYYGSGTLKNCVAYNNGKHGFEFSRVNPIAINCIAKDNGQWGFYANGAAAQLMAPHVAYCCAHGNGSGQFSLSDALPEQNSIEEDPQFVDAANGDFRLKLSSPCLHTGMATLGKL